MAGGRKEELDGKSSWREKLQFVVADITVLYRSFFFLSIFFFPFFCVVVVVVCGLFAGHLDLVEFGAPVREIAGWVLGFDDISASMSLTSISFLIISSRLAQSPSSSRCNEIDEWQLASLRAAFRALQLLHEEEKNKKMRCTGTRSL